MLSIWLGTFANRLTAMIRYLVQMLKELIADGATVRVCGTCMARCGIHASQPYFEGAEKSTMQALSEWVIDSDKVLTF